MTHVLGHIGPEFKNYRDDQEVNKWEVPKPPSQNPWDQFRGGEEIPSEMGKVTDPSTWNTPALGLQPPAAPGQKPWGQDGAVGPGITGGADLTGIPTEAGKVTTPQTDLTPVDDSYVPTDISQYTGDFSGLLDTIGGEYEAILRGEDPLAEQNQNMALTALDRMQSQTDQQTAREAARLGIEPGSDMYTQIMEKNREQLISQGSGVMSNLAAQNMARRDRILTQGAAFAEGRQQFGLDFAKTVENINRYGFEAGIADERQKGAWSQYIMSNPDMFSVAQVGEAKASYFGNLGIDISSLPADPSMAQQAQSEIADHLRVAHPDWDDQQIEDESIRLFGIFSPYTSGAYEKAAQGEGLGLDAGGDVSGDAGDFTGGDTGGFGVDASGRLIPPGGDTGGIDANDPFGDFPNAPGNPWDERLPGDTTAPWEQDLDLGGGDLGGFGDFNLG